MFWEDLCTQVSSANRIDGRSSNNELPADTWMSQQLLSALPSPDIPNDIIGKLRPEDASQFPHLRIDAKTGKVIDWNRSMTDLTGVARSQVVGKKYDDILREWVPSLSDEYRTAAVAWTTSVSDDKKDDYDMRYDTCEDEGFREHNLFPLPLPVKRSENASGDVWYYVELLAAKVDRYSYLYPKKELINEGNDLFDGWVGGTEFTLRKKKLPSLKPLCLEILSQNVFNSGGSALDVSSVVPITERMVLTLKIEVIKWINGQEKTFGEARAVVCVPAALNFFQLHRVVIQTLRRSNICSRETHVWKAKNIASPYNANSMDGSFDYVQLGETYFVENGRRVEGMDGNLDTLIFDNGDALRQRVSDTAAYYDQIVPLYFQKNWCWNFDSVKKLRACIHSTRIDALFFQPGAVVYLEDGLSKYLTKYKITCLRIDEHDGPIPSNPMINIMLPKCISGKCKDYNYENNWSVDKANAKLELDRGCLRRNLCRIGSKECMHQMPWCHSEDCKIGKMPSTLPFALKLSGTDLCPIFLHGEPPLPGSSDYATYVSSLNGRINPEFLQENVLDTYANFPVPFKYGTPSDDSDDCSHIEVVDNIHDRIGSIWEREVDEEMAKIEVIESKNKSKARGKKRKSDTVD